MSIEFRVSIDIELPMAVTAYAFAECRNTPKALLILPSKHSNNVGGHFEIIEFNKMDLEISLHQWG